MFIQSDVPAHAQLAYLLECTSYVGELSRMIQYKEKGKGRPMTRASLFTYPCLMAADILLYGADRVPVGGDQDQHVELARDIAIRFNREYGETFVVPQLAKAVLATRVKDLANPTTKMSKSDADDAVGTIRLLDPPDVIRRQIMRAVTDSENEVRHDEAAKPGVTNLLEILAACTDGDPVAAGDGVLVVRRVEAGRRGRRAGRDRAAAEGVRAAGDRPRCDRRPAGAGPGPGDRGEPAAVRGGGPGDGPGRIRRPGRRRPRRFGRIGAMKIRVATFNIRNSSAPDGDNAWPVRRDATVAAIEALDADVVGLQEVLPDQLEYLRWRFSRYEIVGVGRDDGMSAGEHSVVLVRPGDWKVEKHETRWLSDDPGTPGSVGWDADLTRIATLVWLRHLNGTTIGIANTHYDHAGEVAQLQSSRLIARWIGRRAAVDRDGRPERDTGLAAAEGVDLGRSAERRTGRGRRQLARLHRRGGRRPHRPHPGHRQAGKWSTRPCPTSARADGCRAITGRWSRR